MICLRCQKNVATVHVMEVEEFVSQGHTDNVVHQQVICDSCAQELDLPNVGVPAKAIANIWKLLQYHKEKAQLRKGPVCPDCGMTIEELRRRGRIGCQRDYEVFREYLDDLLERMHGARAHVGRLPGIAESEVERIQRVSCLRDALELAIRDEDYERAASLRDEIKTLEAGSGA